ncbi:kinesin-like protein KIN-4C isoform X2 [Hibiscus syriacus]|nr:kinesin-like protein KIN-4C isoform X2 [Hibiscus syriacus]
MESSDSVRVAVNIRPLITTELVNGCTDCITVVPGEPQVQIGSHSFTYDYVYGGGGPPPSSIYDDCVDPLVDAVFRGYNATVLAYGQTGSGKTYTMGTNYNDEESNGGIIPKVMETIFRRVGEVKNSTEFLIRVSFIEIFKEEVFDLLDSKSTTLGRPPIQIRETGSGGITLSGVTEAEVRTKEEMASNLARGSLSRATGSTNMNSQSSRSHAIFTISIEQNKTGSCLSAVNNDICDDILSAKLHLVDLAGSERAKRTGANGTRLKEGININKGLLALGNVISALGDERKRKEGGHVPYRDSKLARLLQDSLGGNNKTVMIACVSPADTNAEETLNTLKYANRARNIQNKAVINRDPMAAQLQTMRSQIEHLQAELLFYRGDGNGSFDELQILKHKVSLLEASNGELRQELQERRLASEQLAQRALEAQAEKEKLVMQIEAIRNGKSWDEIESNQNQDFDLMKTYLLKIQELEGELIRLKSLNSSKCRRISDSVVEDEDGTSKNSLFSSGNDYLSSDDIEDNEKEVKHSTLQEKLDRELMELDKRLEQKEAEMKRFASSGTSVLKQLYEKKVNELEHEKRTLQKEIEELRHNLGNISSPSDVVAQKLEEEYLHKLNVLESQVAELKKKQDVHAQLLRQKQKSDEAAKRLQDEIQRIRSQKVQLQQKIKQEAEQFKLWKASREKEVQQLKKEGRRNEYEMHKLLALNQRQKMVLQRKTEESAMATKRLKELLESRKASSREAPSAGNGSGPGVQAIMQTVEHELEVTVRVHDVRSQYERQMAERAKMAKEVSGLKEKAEILKHSELRGFHETMSAGARYSRIFALENMLAATSTSLVDMASQLSEAEERERTFNGRGRWNHVWNLSEAKSIMNYLFNLASSSRCSLRDKEVSCREKDAEIKYLKEKVVILGGLTGQLAAEKADLAREMKMKEQRNSMDDMYTSQLENSDMNASDDDDWMQSEEERARRKASRATRANEMKINKGYVDEVKGLFCCSCSEKSLCETSKCQCRANGSCCGQSCDCSSVKCCNRETEANIPNDVSTDEENNLVVHSAMLLQNALGSEKEDETEEDGHTGRKALSEIGNIMAKRDAAKPNKRKKLRKSLVQLVPTAPPSSDRDNRAAPLNTKNADPPKQPDGCPATESEIGSKLPRAMRPAASSTSSKLL